MTPDMGVEQVLLVVTTVMAVVGIGILFHALRQAAMERDHHRRRQVMSDRVATVARTAQELSEQHRRVLQPILTEYLVANQRDDLKEAERFLRAAEEYVEEVMA